MKATIIATVLMMSTLAHASMEDLNKVVTVDCAGRNVQVHVELLTEAEIIIETSTKLSEADRAILREEQSKAIKNVGEFCKFMKKLSY